jgi:molybdopterin synthase sulfur carrier subunit
MKPYFSGMTLQILAFGVAREICGGRQIQLDVADGTDTDRLKEILTEHFPEMSRLAQLSLAVNSEYITDPVLLNSGDEIALIPPVSGG